VIRIDYGNREREGIDVALVRIAELLSKNFT
jgi:hypothetical protein